MPERHGVHEPCPHPDARVSVLHKKGDSQHAELPEGTTRQPEICFEEGGGGAKMGGGGGWRKWVPQFAGELPADWGSFVSKDWEEGDTSTMFKRAIAHILEKCPRCSRSRFLETP